MMDAGNESCHITRLHAHQCGVCARWTRNGDFFESGLRDAHSGQTPTDNFFCWKCQAEAKSNWFVRRVISVLRAA